MKIVTVPAYTGLVLTCAICRCQWSLDQNDHPSTSVLAMDGRSGSLTFACPACGAERWVAVPVDGPAAETD